MVAPSQKGLHLSTSQTQWRLHFSQKKKIIFIRRRRSPFGRRRRSGKRSEQCFVFCRTFSCPVIHAAILTFIFVVVSNPAGCLERNCSTRGLLSAENLFKFDCCSSKELLHRCVVGLGITFQIRHIYTWTTERFSKAR